MRRIIPILLCLLTGPTSVSAQSTSSKPSISQPQPPEKGWTQWHGPTRDNRSDAKGLLQTWPKDGPKLLWTFKTAGSGFAGCAVAKGRVYTLGSDEKDAFALCVDLGTGEEVWRTKIGPITTNASGDGPASTPTVIGGRLYGLTRRGNLACINADDGKIIWKQNLPELTGVKPPRLWGYTDSVLVDDDKVLCSSGEGNMIVALDKDSGKKRWEGGEKNQAGTSYSPIIAALVNGKRQYIKLNLNSVMGLAENGELAWRTNWQGRTVVVAPPVFHEGQVYVTQGYNVGCGLFRVDGKSPQMIYQNKNACSQFTGLVLEGDHLYGHSDSGGWICQDFKTGELIWSEKQAMGKGFIAWADQRLYVFGFSKYTIALIEPSPKGWIEHGRVTLPQVSALKNRSGYRSHPSIAQGRMILRDQEFIFCYDVHHEPKK